MTATRRKSTPKKKTLKQLYATHKGKASDRWSSYLAEYERIFAEYRDKPVRLLEIGVQNGGSLEIWSQYFPNARKIVGCDIDPACAHLSYDDPRIAVVIGDANSDAAQEAILGHAAAFDILIEDGSHRSSDIQKSFARYFPRLAYGGVFIAEDLHCSYWREYEGGLYDPFSSITFFKRLADTVNHEHWGIGKSRADILSGIFSKYGFRMSEEALETVHSVQFMNSLCVVRKDKRELNRLNRRVITGSVAMVHPEISKYHSQPALFSDQTSNEWTARSMPPGEELPLRIKELEAGKARIEELEGALVSRDAELEAGEARIYNLEAALASRDKELEAGKARIEEVKAKLSARERDIQKLKTSTSWRLTKPLRAVSRGLRWLLRNTRRALMLVWWLGTGQFSRAAKASLPYYRRFVPISSQRNASSVKVGHRGENEGQLEKRVVTADNKAALAAFLASGARLCLPASEQPEVCIVLVLYNQAHFTLACLRSIAADVGVPMEVVIVDNASSDETPALLKRIEGARVIWNEENLGFLKGANQGAGEANAPYILFLNNDALLLPGTLSAALETLERESNVGAVGAKIILPGGALQEAGSIIWRDGSCVGYGRGGNPVAPEFMFRRNVDYVSGAFLLTPHQIWKELGGFDLAFAPAYYEETDYCMRMRKAGYRIVYEPRAQIFHYEFGSSKDPTAAIELQRNNQSLLYERHKDVLTRAHYASYPRCTLFARSRSAKAGRVLFIDDRVPDPRAGGGFPRANAIVLTLQELGYFVTHYPLRVPEEHWETVYKCMPREVEVMLGHGIDGLRPFLEERKGYYDAVIVSRPHNMAQLKRLLNSAPDLLGGAKLIYDAEAVFALRKNLQWEALGKTMSESRKNENVLREVTMAAEADVVLAVSEGEAAHFRQNLIRDVKILGNMIEPDPTPAEFEERDLFLFVGRMNEDNSPNVDSVIWFYEEILPRLRERIGKLPEIALIGLNSAPQLTKIDRKQLNFIGPIDDLEAYYNRARLFFAPTRFSGGLPHKVHEAAARGVPAVVTPILVHQLGWVHEKEVLVGETAEAFADQCVRLATDRTLWTRLRTSALERVTEECSRETFRTTLQDIMPDCPSSNDLRRMAV